MGCRRLHDGEGDARARLRALRSHISPFPEPTRSLPVPSAGAGTFRVSPGFGPAKLLTMLGGTQPSAAANCRAAMTLYRAGHLGCFPKDFLATPVRSLSPSPR